MNNKKVTGEWVSAHSILWIVCLFCICLASITVLSDIRAFMRDGALNVTKYVIAALVAGGAFVGQAKGKKKAE